MPANDVQRRDVYANLLRDTRGMRREHASAREAWYAALDVDRKEEILLELEMLLKGFACFGNPRNQPGHAQRPPAVARDFREELRILRDGIDQATEQIRLLLGPKDRAYVFSRYLESVLPEDAERSRLVRDQLSQDTPEEALFMMRNAFGSFLEMADGMLRLTRIPHRLYFALLGTVVREIGRNAYFNPLTTLEFRPEFDRIRQPEILEALHSVEHDAAHRIAALTFLTVARAERYLRIVERYAQEPTTARRAYIMLAVLRSDLRALGGFLGGRAGDVLANGLERDVLAIHASEIASRYDAMAARMETLAAMRSAISGMATSLRLDIRKVYERDLPTVEEEVSDPELSSHLMKACESLRRSLHHVTRSLCAELRPESPVPTLADDERSRRAASERLRTDVWMFMQILRGFLIKTQAAAEHEDRWATYASFRFVHEFLGHFRAIGYQLVRRSDYERLDAFLAALETLRTADLLDPDRLQIAATECGAFYDFLSDLFERISMREELRDHPFDRKDAAEMLRIYLGAS